MGLELREVNTYRGPAHVLRGVSLTVEDGQTTCLVGRNGAGKTTTMGSIMGTLPMRSGSVLLDRQDIGREPPYRRARLGIGYAPDDCGVFPDLTVAENLRIGQWQARTPANTASPSSEGAHMEAIFGLFPELRRLLDRRGLFLSGGERKMVAIARAMALRPSILLLDEAFEGLAPVVVNRFAAAVRQIQGMGISLLIAESNIATAGKVADRLYVIDRGEIIFRGSPQEAFASKEVMNTIRG